MEKFDEALKEVCEGLVRRAEAERRQTEPWKNLFAASEKGLSGLLSQATRQLDSVIHNTIDVIKQRFGIQGISEKLYTLLKALPFALGKVRDEIQNAEGLSCCADKARKVYYQEVLAEIEAIRQREQQ